jgi:hypothetical protein
VHDPVGVTRAMHKGWCVVKPYVTQLMQVIPKDRPDPTGVASSRTDA